MLVPLQLEMLLNYFGINNTQYPELGNLLPEQSEVVSANMDGDYISSITECNIFDNKMKLHLLKFAKETEDTQLALRILDNVYALGLSKLTEQGLIDSQAAKDELFGFVSSLKVINDLSFDNNINTDTFRSAIHCHFNRVGDCDDHTGFPVNSNEIKEAISILLNKNLEILTSRYDILTPNDIENFNNLLESIAGDANWRGGENALYLDETFSFLFYTPEEQEAIESLVRSGYARDDASAIVRGIDEQEMQLIVRLTDSIGIIPNIRQLILGQGGLSSEASDAIVALTTNNHNRILLPQAIEVIRNLDAMKLTLLCQISNLLGFNPELVHTLEIWAKDLSSAHVKAIFSLMTNPVSRLSIQQALEFTETLYESELLVIGHIAANQGADSVLLYKNKFQSLSYFFRKENFKEVHANLLLSLTNNPFNNLSVEEAFDVIQNFGWNHNQQRISQTCKLYALSKICSKIGANLELCNLLAGWRAEFTRDHGVTLNALLVGPNKFIDVNEALNLLFFITRKANNSLLPDAFEKYAQILITLVSLRDFTDLIGNLDYNLLESREFSAGLDIDAKKSIFFNRLLCLVIHGTGHKDLIIDRIREADDNQIKDMLYQRVQINAKLHKRRREDEAEMDGGANKRNRDDDNDEPDISSQTLTI